jgi:hypothetical protein
VEALSERAQDYSDDPQSLADRVFENPSVRDAIAALEEERDEKAPSLISTEEFRRLFD